MKIFVLAKIWNYGLKLQVATPLPVFPMCLCYAGSIAVTAPNRQKPMLKDLILVMKSIKTYIGKRKIPDYHPNQTIADASNDLGYWYFNEHKFIKAQNNFLHSLKTKITLRAIIYWIICLLPHKLIIRLRKIKHI